MRKLNLFYICLFTGLANIALPFKGAEAASANFNTSTPPSKSRERSVNSGTYTETGKTGKTGVQQQRIVTKGATIGTTTAYQITGTSPEGFTYTRNVEVTPNSGGGYDLTGEGITMNGPKGRTVYTITSSDGVYVITGPEGKQMPTQIPSDIPISGDVVDKWLTVIEAQETTEAK